MSTHPQPRDSGDVVQIVTTTSSESEAQEIAAQLIDQRLAACVQVEGPITSHYRWQGAIEQSTEWRATIKTTRRAAAGACELIRRCHSYEEPEILVLAVTGGSDGYLRWVAAEVDPR